MRGAARRLVRAIGFGLLRVSRRFERAGQALAVATLTRDELDALTVSEWEAFADLGPAGAEDPLPWETGFFAKYIQSTDSILVVGAGAGRDVLPFLRAGHDVTALDIAPRALATLREKARTLGLTVATLCSSITRADLPREGFDVVLFSWFCFGYLRGAEDRRTALSKSEAALRESGRILLSYISRSDDSSPRSPRPWLFRVAARWLGGTRTEPGDRFNVTGTSARPSVFFSHSFTRGEIEEEARQSGLVVAFHDQPTPGVGVLALTRSRERAL